jgi:hypothetical protein
MDFDGTLKNSLLKLAQAAQAGQKTFLCSDWFGLAQMDWERLGGAWASIGW